LPLWSATTLVHYNCAEKKERILNNQEEKKVIEALVSHEPTTASWHMPIQAAEQAVDWKEGTASFIPIVKKLIEKGRIQDEPVLSDGPKYGGLRRWVRK
jgi:hypothetical protein